MIETNIIKLNKVKNLTALSRTTIYRLIANGKFPKQIKLSERSSGWLLSEIDEWLDEKINARDGMEKANEA